MYRCVRINIVYVNKQLATVYLLLQFYPKCNEIFWHSFFLIIYKFHPMQDYIYTIRQKIDGLKTAIMYSTSNDVLKLPTHIVHTLKVDDNGCLWFIVPKPSQHITAFENKFPVELQYFKKGSPDVINVHGAAQIVTDEAAIAAIDFVSEERKSELLVNHIFLNVKMMQVELNELEVERRSFWQSLKHSMLQLIAPPVHHQTFDLSI